MDKKDKSKKELIEENANNMQQLDMVREDNLDQQNQLQQLSMAYQNILMANTNLGVLVDKYEETINLLTARLIELKNAASVAQQEQR
tara:strand:- start:3954 stop:4214 length:261 start_codon:yes stop_codon:yes gene_type:complete